MITKDKERALDAMLKQADAALYSAKEAGRNCWRFNHGGHLTGSLTDVKHKIAFRPAVA